MKHAIQSLKHIVEDLWVLRENSEISDEDVEEITKSISEIFLIINEHDLSNMVTYIQFLNRTVKAKVWKHD